MFRLEKGVNEYIIESLSEMQYTAPDIYNRKVKAMTSTFPRNRGELTDLTDFLNMNIYSSSIMTDKLLSPLDRESSKFYTYLLDSIVEVDTWPLERCWMLTHRIICKRYSTSLWRRTWKTLWNNFPNVPMMSKPHSGHFIGQHLITYKRMASI